MGHRDARPAGPPGRASCGPATTSCWPAPGSCPGAGWTAGPTRAACGGSPTRAARWGSCTPVDRTIRLSTRLQGMPPWVVDYVLVHELAHLLVPGHGPDFWAVVDRFRAPSGPVATSRASRDAGRPRALRRRPGTGRRLVPVRRLSRPQRGPGPVDQAAQVVHSLGRQAVGREPRDVVATRRWPTGSAPGGADHGVPHVEVLAAAARTPTDSCVPVQVDRACADQPQPVDAGLLGRPRAAPRGQAGVARLA